MSHHLLVDRDEHQICVPKQENLCRLGVHLRCRYFCISESVPVQESITFLADERITYLAFANWLCLRLQVWV
jgi:hypothetical protein